MWNNTISWNQADQELYGDPVFGSLWWDYEEAEWVGDGKIAESSRVSVIVHTDDDRAQDDFDPTRYLPDARVLWGHLAQNYAAIHAAATAYSVREYARVREEDPREPEYDVLEIAAKLIPYFTLISVGFWRTTSVTVCFEDGGLFDHSINVDIASDCSVTDIYLSG